MESRSFLDTCNCLFSSLPGNKHRGRAACANACDDGLFADRLGGGRHCALVPWHGACRLDERGCRPRSHVRCVFGAFAFARAGAATGATADARPRFLASFRTRHEKSCDRRRRRRIQASARRNRTARRFETQCPAVSRGRPQQQGRSLGGRHSTRDFAILKASPNSPPTI